MACLLDSDGHRPLLLGRFAMVRGRAALPRRALEALRSLAGAYCGQLASIALSTSSVFVPLGVDPLDHAVQNGPSRLPAASGQRRRSRTPWRWPRCQLRPPACSDLVPIGRGRRVRGDGRCRRRSTSWDPTGWHRNSATALTSGRTRPWAASGPSARRRRQAPVALGRVDRREVEHADVLAEHVLGLVGRIGARALVGEEVRADTRSPGGASSSRA